MFLNRFFNFSESIDLRNKWIYIAFLGNILVTAIQAICNSIIYHRNLQFRIFFFLLYFLLFIADDAAFIIAIKTSYRQFYSFAFSILTPTIILLTSIIYSILFAIRAMNAKNLIRVIIEFKPGMISLILIKVAFSFCYGSPLGMVLVIEDLALTICKVLLLPNRYKVMKKKID